MNQIPDNVIFGINEANVPIDYGYVRAINDENVLITLLKLRLEVFFINQVEPLLIAQCAFPLSTMVCVGIETLGNIFIKERKDDVSFQFVEILKRLNQNFGRKPNKKFNTQLTLIWKDKDLKNIDSFGKIVYRFFRNTMIHGYQGKGMYLSWESISKIEIDDNSGFIVLNPGWFWEIFKEYFYRKFDEILKSEINNTERQNCLFYIRNYLLG